MVAEHVEYEPGRMFADRLVKGPFKKWLHRHVVTPRGANECVLTDDIEYELPLGVLGRTFGGAFARKNLERLFAITGLNNFIAALGQGLGGDCPDSSLILDQEDPSLAGQVGWLRFGTRLFQRCTCSGAKQVYHG